MSSILDALRKAHPKKPDATVPDEAPPRPSAPGAEPARPETAQPPVTRAVTPPVVPPARIAATESVPSAATRPATATVQPAATGAGAGPERSGAASAGAAATQSGVTDAARVQPAITSAATRPTQPLATGAAAPPAEPGVTNAAASAPPQPAGGTREGVDSERSRSHSAAGARPVALPPPLGEFPTDDDPLFLATVEDAADRRRKTIRAGIVVAIGVVLGLAIGDRFLDQTPSTDDDLVSESVRTATRGRAADPAVGVEPVDAPPRLPQDDATVAADPAPTAADTGKRADAPRGGGRRAAKAGAEPGGEGAAEAGADSAGEVAKAEPAAEVAAQQVRSKPAMMPDPARAAPDVPLSPPVAADEAPPPALPPAGVPAPAAETVPSAPVAAVAPPPATPIELPPLPDDAPQLALLFIQWSSDASRRVASLRQSGGTISIVHEGDVIQGLKVALIRPAAVEMQWRGQSYSLPASRH